jgi:hypothetical protein
MEKRRCLFTKYEFEIGALTLPAHAVLLSAGLALSNRPEGMLMLLIGFLGSAAAIGSLVHGSKEITF